MLKKVGFIPVRKGSKEIKGKNKKKLLGRPLFSWVLTEALFSDLDEVYLFTDDEDIIMFANAQYQWSNKLKVIKRSPENAQDTSSTEAAMIEFAASINHDFELICLLQATSPLTSASNINECISKVEGGDYTSSLTVVNTKRFAWDKGGQAVNYDPMKRPRRQDFEGLNVENGAVYCTTKKAFLESKNRVSGNIALVQMGEDTLVEIDGVSDWLIVEQLMMERMRSKKHTEKIKTLILDVDGVFTKGTVTFNSSGEFSKEFDMRDGMGLEILREHEVDLIVMTSENSELVQKRMDKLQIQRVYLGVKDKYALLKSILQETNTSQDSYAYIGDDVNDLACLSTVGWSFAPANATSIVYSQVDVKLSHASGAGAIREACEFIITYNKRF